MTHGKAVHIQAVVENVFKCIKNKHDKKKPRAAYES